MVPRVSPAKPARATPGASGARRSVAAAALALALLAGCISTPTRPGLPVAAPGGAEGPVHVQRVVEVREDRVVVVERVEADARPPDARRLVLDARGQVLAEAPVDPLAPLPPAELAPLPVSAGEGVLEGRRRGDAWEVLLAGGDAGLPPAVLVTVPSADRTRLLGARVGAGSPPRLAVVSFRSSAPGIRVEGVRVLDLVRGRARRRLLAGAEARARGDLAAAESALRAAWRIDPHYADAAYALASVLVARDEPEAAVEWLERALSLDRRRLTARLARDPAFDPLRDRADFRAVAGPGSELPGLPGGP